ncbi:MAG: Transcriptional regulator TrmB [Candidatus Peregrinibacteria bacterium GW2011_GWF2_33_10]|nr:MAG: Transcriptional regulator TrmB [Candidatus Peregrinibacteria bacterium GW2011_GWF2_33_10]OGJ44225.1 MAG: hypothetical protein A2263_04595 [Candidatus Peregrinibacteria bacterium RIFOXYA2_FULL_33_21]OGJ47208.1 MAG: hypothetical protein A2272_06385 [Candidatus Peregrinibacteria bacterium RIFOXYA12_FULL_33_12]OGJ49936.1 MAG: hypothetical protein A2307_00770 [Candidatus Peregrinibacteria bacterium RIFOXYB2_FULL_33_20]
MDLTKALETLGLNKNEVKVYLALLSLGLTQAGEIVKKSKLHRMIVYNALDKLVDLKLASFVYVKNIKKFQASNPNIFLDLISEKEHLVKSIIPELQKLQKSAEEELEVKILYGHSGFISNLETLVKIATRYDKIMRILGGAEGDCFYSAVADWYRNYVDLLKKYKVAKWQISPDSTSKAFKEKFACEKNTKLKTLKIGLSSPTLTRITPEMVSIEIYTKEIVIIQIYNKAVSQGYLESFELLWKQATLYQSKKHVAIEIS